MAKARWNERFFASTRGQIVLWLRRGSRTVNDLAEVLGLTDNGVRAHLAGLERDGLVEQEGVRRGIGKPAYVYRLTPEADALFPKAYAFLAGLLLEDLRERTGDGFAAALREVGRRAGEAAGVQGRDAVERLGGALAVLATLGGDTEVTTQNGRSEVCAHGCALSAVVAEDAQTCGVLEGFLEGAVGVPVREHCEHGDRPRCRFEVQTGALAE